MRAQHGSALFAVTCALAAGLAVGHAQAQGCEVDADCGAGYACEISTSQACSGRACLPGETCPPPVCETFRWGSCVNAACRSDADCPDPMLCHEETYTECDDYASDDDCADDGQPCTQPPVPPSSCTTHSETRCREPYELPCGVDADCGGGFACVESVTKWCNGSEGRKDGGTLLPSEPECGEEHTGTYYCQLLELACSVDSDCPTGLTCVDQPDSVACSGGTGPFPAGVDAGAGVARPDFPVTPQPTDGGVRDAGWVVCETTPADPPRRCMPRRWTDDGASGGDNSSEPSTSTGKDAGVSGGAKDAGAAPPPDGDDDEAEEPQAGGGKGPRHRRGKLRAWLRHALEGGRGCSMASAQDGPSSDLSWLLVAGALALPFVRRRR